MVKSLPRAITGPIKLEGTKDDFNEFQVRRLYRYNCRNPRNCHYVLAFLSVLCLYIGLYIPNIYTKCSTFFSQNFIKTSMGINKKINVIHNRGCLKLYRKIIWKWGMRREQYLSFDELTKSLNFLYMGNFERRKYII